MADNQPREYDAIIGGQVPPPVNGLVLGGIEGVIRRLAGADVEQRIAALKDALQYGEPGLELLIQALQDTTEKVNQTAYLLLRNRRESKVKQSIWKYNPWRFLKCLGRLYGYS
ncbi:hypothetical protein H6G76_33815 [Nostoc sp. FACHB-152]|uniref:hypothetical protein n=1 Tax=unclassified Nostoc TaxID=2593658 RepID=UPI0016857F7B|nr:MULTISPECIES: hypothetical protein [unclassified Nostoc]MBD2452006.1 hypothetical protein [Nostoc sp. FACHB-152]MBD2472994.1 hypothetical protein [Nostoc sp. FACHB-145]